MTDTSKLNVEISTEKARKDADKFNKSLDTMEKKGTKAGKSVKKTGKEATDATKGFNSLKTAVAGVFTAALLLGITKTIAKFESLKFSLGIVFDDMERGTAVFQDIQKLAEITPFGVDSLTESVIKLRAAGIEPTIAQLTLFSDTASVTTDAIGSLQAITDLFARTTAGGLGLEDLNRLADRGIPVFTILEEKLGLARLEVSKLGQTSEGAARILDALTKGLEERFGGASQKAADLLTVTISNMGDTWDRFQDSLGDAGGTAVLIATIGSATSVLSFFADNLDLVAIAAGGLTTLVLPSLIAGIKLLTAAIIANPIGLIVTGITVAVAALWHFREVMYESLIRMFTVALPNAVDRANISFLELKKGVGDTMNGVLEEIESFANNMINNTPDWLKKFFGIDKDPFSFVIDTDSVTKQIDALEKAILDRRANFKVPKLPAFLLPDQEKEKGGGLATNDSLTGNLIKGTGATDIITDAQKAAAQKGLDALEKSLFNEEERLFDSYANRQFMLENALDAELISTDKHASLLLKLKGQYENELTDLQNKGATEREKFMALSFANQTKTVVGELINMTASVATENRKMFELNKAAGIANAIINTFQGVSESLAAYPMPLAGIMAALHLASGLAQVAAIRNTSFSGATAAPSSVSGAGATTAETIQPVELPTNEEVTPTRVINIFIEGSAIGDDAVREVIIDAWITAEENDELDRTGT